MLFLLATRFGVIFKVLLWMVIRIIIDNHTNVLSLSLRLVLGSPASDFLSEHEWLSEDTVSMLIALYNARRAGSSFFTIIFTPIFPFLFLTARLKWSDVWNDAKGGSLTFHPLPIFCPLVPSSWWHRHAHMRSHWPPSWHVTQSLWRISGLQVSVCPLNTHDTMSSLLEGEERRLLAVEHQAMPLDNWGFLWSAVPPFCLQCFTLRSGYPFKSTLIYLSAQLLVHLFVCLFFHFICQLI